MKLTPDGAGDKRHDQSGGKRGGGCGRDAATAVSDKRERVALITAPGRGRGEGSAGRALGMP